MPDWPVGTGWVILALLALNLIVLLEVFERLSLKNDLEIAREIQKAMLPRGLYADRASRPLASRGPPTPWAEISTTCCRCRTAACSSPSGTWPAREAPRPCSWPCCWPCSGRSSTKDSNRHRSSRA